MADKNQNMQDVFLNTCRREKKPVTVYLVNGVKLQGFISGFDNFSLVLKRSQQSQLVYKHSIATIVPNGNISFQADDESTQHTHASPQEDYAQTHYEYDNSTYEQEQPLPQSFYTTNPGGN